VLQLLLSLLLFALHGERVEVRKRMKKTTFLFVITSLLTASLNAAVIPKWFHDAIRVNQPRQLAYFLALSPPCTIPIESLDKIVVEILTEYKIRPMKEEIFNDGRIYLNLAVNCITFKSNDNAFVIEANFARYTPSPPIIFDQQFGISGKGNNDNLREAFKTSVKAAISEHVSSNFGF